MTIYDTRQLVISRLGISKTYTLWSFFRIACNFTLTDGFWQTTTNSFFIRHRLGNRSCNSLAMQSTHLVHLLHISFFPFSFIFLHTHSNPLNPRNNPRKNSSSKYFPFLVIPYSSPINSPTRPLKSSFAPSFREQYVSPLRYSSISSASSDSIGTGYDSIFALALVSTDRTCPRR